MQVAVEQPHRETQHYNAGNTGSVALIGLTRPTYCDKKLLDCCYKGAALFYFQRGDRLNYFLINVVICYFSDLAGRHQHFMILGINPPGFRKIVSKSRFHRRMFDNINSFRC